MLPSSPRKDWPTRSAIGRRSRGNWQTRSDNGKGTFLSKRLWGLPYPAFRIVNAEPGGGKPSPYGEWPFGDAVGRAVQILRSELFLMLGNKLADGGDKVVGNHHYGVVLFGERGFILGHRFFRRLLLIVREDAPNSVFVPSRREFTLGHICLLRLRFR